MKLIVGITGASGSIYAKKLITEAIKCENVKELAVISSVNAIDVWKQELDEDLRVFLKTYSSKLKVYENNDFFAPPASGSSDFNAMVIVPCSMATLGKIANGISNTLMTRASDVMLKERKKLVISVREAPYNLIHIENMKKITLAGGIIFPLSPVFYTKPASITELVEHIVDRILNVAAGCEKQYSWGGI